MRIVKAAILLAILIGGCQCEDEPTDICMVDPGLCQLITPVEVFVDVTSATPQTGFVSSPVASPPAIRLSRSDGQTVSCLASFEVNQGGGLLTPSGIFGSAPATTAFAQTDANGTARVAEWRLGSAAGLNRARVSSVTCVSPIVTTIIYRTNSFEAMAVVPVPASLTKVEGDGQTGTAGEVVAVAPKVLVRGQQNVPVPNTQVMFRVLSGGGSVNNAPAYVTMTDATGHASAPMWRLGPLVSGASLNELEASVTTLSPVVFRATSAAGAPRQVTAASVPAGGAGSLATPEPLVLVVDANGNPVPNAAVRFDVLAGGGSVNPGTSQTDATGRARTAWMLGPQAGMLNRLTASVLASNQPDPNVLGNPVTFDHTAPATGSICVYITVYGEPLANVAVSVTGPDTRSGATDSDGVITFANLTPGAYTVTITPPAGITFTSTSQTVTVTAGATPGVFFEGFGARPDTPDVRH